MLSWMQYLSAESSTFQNLCAESSNVPVQNHQGRESDKYLVKTESRRGCMQYLCAESSNISKFVCGIIKCSGAESSR